MNQRMITQAGTFLIPSRRIDVPIDSLLPESLVLKLTLHTSRLRRETMTSLYSMNIDNGALFPGIDGFARSLAFKLEYVWRVIHRRRNGSRGVPGEYKFSAFCSGALWSDRLLRT
jgi:hypothetical protein